MCWTHVQKSEWKWCTWLIMHRNITPLMTFMPTALHKKIYYSLTCCKQATPNYHTIKTRNYIIQKHQWTQLINTHGQNDFFRNKWEKCLQSKERRIKHRTICDSILYEWKKDPLLQLNKNLQCSNTMCNTVKWWSKSNVKIMKTS